MGVKHIVSIMDLPMVYHGYELIPTSHGVSATVYLIGDRYVLKMFDDEYPKEQIESEMALHRRVESLPIPRIIESIEVAGHPALIYEQIAGESPDVATDEQIVAIGRFLREFHTLTDGYLSDNSALFGIDRVSRMIKETKSTTLKSYLERIEIEPTEDRFIHGDLFMDNAKFKGDTLCGVYDFSDACYGDIYFELGVVALSWCMHKGLLSEVKIELLLKSYGADIPKEYFEQYINYALLYYATTRYADGRDYQALLRLWRRKI